MYGMDIFQRDGEVWQRSFEEHREYIYTFEGLKKVLEESGFEDIRAFGELRFEMPKDDEMRIFISSRKKNS